MWENETIMELVRLTRTTRVEVESVILELLGEELKTEPGELGQRLSAAGAQMPIDSVIMVEILVRVETRFGVRVAETAPTAWALRSVCGFAELIVTLAQKNEAEDGD